MGRREKLFQKCPVTPCKVLCLDGRFPLPAPLAAKPAGVEVMLNDVYRAPAEPLGSLNLSKRRFSFSCAVENLLEQKTTRIALDSVPGVRPGGAGEGGDPNKTHQPGLL